MTDLPNQHAPTNPTVAHSSRPFGLSRAIDKCLMETRRMNIISSCLSPGKHFFISSTTPSGRTSSCCPLAHPSRRKSKLVTWDYDAEHFWLGQLRKGNLVPLSEFTNPSRYPATAPHPDLSPLQQRWPEVWQGLHDYVDTLPESEFALELHAIDWSIPRWKLLLHVVNHATLHRGQVMSMFRQLGKQPPSNDIFIGYHLSHP
jgi:hypothetical protein